MPGDFFEVTVVGMRFQENVTQSDVLDLPTLFLKPQPDNPHDPKAVAVLCPKTRRILGHVSRDTLSQIPPCPPEGKNYEIYLCDSSGPYAVRIVAFTNTNPK